VKSAPGNPPASPAGTPPPAAPGLARVSLNATTGRRVTDLTVFALNISAPVPAAVADLTALRSVDLAYNRLHCGIPAFLGPRALPGLTFLRLDGNRLLGGLPSRPSRPSSNPSSRGTSSRGSSRPGTDASAAFGYIDLAGNRFAGDASALLGDGKQLNALRLSPRATGSSSTSAAWSSRRRWTSWRSTTTWCTAASRRPRRRGSGWRST